MHTRKSSCVTARGVPVRPRRSITRSLVWGYPCPVQGVPPVLSGVPHPVQEYLCPVQGYPLSCPDWGTPWGSHCLVLTGLPPPLVRTWTRTLDRTNDGTRGYLLERTWGRRLGRDLRPETRYPPPPPRWWTN